MVILALPSASGGALLGEAFEIPQQSQERPGRDPKLVQDVLSSRGSDLVRRVEYRHEDPSFLRERFGTMAYLNQSGDLS